MSMIDDIVTCRLLVARNTDNTGALRLSAEQTKN